MAQHLAYRKNPATLAQDVTEQVLQIRDGSTVFHLRGPIDLTVRQEGQYVLIGYEPLGIQESGRTQEEALDAFAYHFGALWEEIAQTEAAKLTKDARELKREMHSLVGRVSTTAS